MHIWQSFTIVKKRESYCPLIHNFATSRIRTLTLLTILMGCLGDTIYKDKCIARYHTLSVVFIYTMHTM